MFDWFRDLFADKKEKTTDDIWSDLVPGDLICVKLKDPKSVGIINTNLSLTHQRLDAEDIEKLSVEGFVIGVTRHGTKPQNIDLLTLDVIKKRGTQTRLVSYILLREEVESIKHIKEKKQ